MHESAFSALCWRAERRRKRINAGNSLVSDFLLRGQVLMAGRVASCSYTQITPRSSAEKGAATLL